MVDSTQLELLFDLLKMDYCTGRTLQTLDLLQLSVLTFGKPTRAPRAPASEPVSTAPAGGTLGDVSVPSATMTTRSRQTVRATLSSSATIKGIGSRNPSCKRCKYSCA